MVLALALALTLALGACGGDDGDDEIRSGGAEETPASTPVSETTATVSEELSVCELATEADVEAAFEEDLPSGNVASGSTDEDGVQWQSDNCNWEIEEGTEVRLAVSTAEDFADGELLCPELDSFGTPGTPVEGLGDQASWVVDDIDPNEGTLRICTATHLLDIDIDSAEGTRDADTMREQSVALAEIVLANLR